MGHAVLLNICVNYDNYFELVCAVVCVFFFLGV